MNLSQRQADALGHIVGECRRAAEIVAARPSRRSGPEWLAADWQWGYALRKCVEIIGEAAKRLGPAIHGAHPHVPWRAVAGMRDRLTHGYDQVRYDVLWSTAERDLPVLCTQVEAMVQAMRAPVVLPGDGSPQTGVGGVSPADGISSPAS